MHKIKGWTKQPFKGCTICRHVKNRIVCQATWREYSTLYCEECAREELSRRKPEIDDSEREWYWVSGAHRYM